jgi:myo-inositol-1(or 4)-monophosphatase
MDREVEAFIRGAIAARFPGDAVIGEEQGGSRGERLWLVDPIDGTANYARGIPHYCVSIAFLEHGVPVLGAIHDPSHDWLYAAEHGGGAWLGDRRIRVSDCAALDGATVECGWSLRRPNAEYVALIERLLGAGAQVRRAGSGALGLADVAAGRSEAYCELHINAWDCAAGIVLVREAGGACNAFFAGNGLASGNPIIGINAALADALAQVTGIAIAR